MKTKKGFTLIELLVVIAIIGLLATLGIIAFRDAQRKGRDTKRMGDVQNIVSALSQANNEGAYVICRAGCAANPAAGDKISALRICKRADCAGAAADESVEFINLGVLSDPLQTGTMAACTAASTAQCDYGYVPATTAYKLDGFSLYFWTEQNNLPGLTATYLHKANSTGVMQ